MEKDKISPVALVLTFLFHAGLFYLAMTHFTSQHTHRKPYTVPGVFIPVSTEFHPHEEKLADILDLDVPAESIVASDEIEQPVDRDRYYLPQELSQQVYVVQDETANLDIPIKQVVTMTLYINEAGGVDDVTIEDKGSLTEADKDQLILAFKTMIFLPGMRGAKVVKSIYRIQLQINRKITFHR